MKISKIKCSQCDMEFQNGYDYRMHWEKVHLDDAIKVAKRMKNGMQDIKKTLDDLDH